MTENLSELGVKPSLEYLIQYPVKNVLTKDGGGYVIEFESGALLGNEDTEAEVPEITDGACLLTVILGKEDTRCLFANSFVDPVTQLPTTVNETWVTLVPGDYTLTDPRFPDAVAYKPQTADELSEAETQASIREQFNKMAAGDAQDAPEPPEES